MFSLTFIHSEVFDVVQWHNSGTTQCKKQVVVLIKSSRTKVLLTKVVVLNSE